MSYPKSPDFTTVVSVKKKRPKVIAIVNDNCTGCEVCVPFCPVDCIDHETPPGFPFESASAAIAPIRIRAHECIGCMKCAKACETLTWNAIDMISTEQFETEFGAKITDSHLPGAGEPVAYTSLERKSPKATA